MAKALLAVDPTPSAAERVATGVSGEVDGGIDLAIPIGLAVFGFWFIWRMIKRVSRG